jgi:hypothetical protein
MYSFAEAVFDGETFLHTRYDRAAKEFLAFVNKSGARADAA